MSLDDPEENDGLRWLAVAKNKDGPLGRICLKFDAAHMEFTATDSRAWHRRAEPRAYEPKFTPVDDNVQEVFPL